MPKRLSRFSIFETIIITLMFLGVSSFPAHAAYPEPDDLLVNDYAGLLTAEDTSNIQSLFRTLKEETGIEAVVVTIGSIRDYGTEDSTIESFATNLFNTWGIGDKEKNNGVLILVAVNDRKMRIELGSGYKSFWDIRMKEVIEEEMVPSFQRDDYSRGIYKGARAMIEKLTGTEPEDLSPTTTRIKDWFSDSWFTIRNLHPGILVGGGAGGSFAALMLFLNFLRYRKRYCPNCHTEMVRLDETLDDAYLDAGQQKEELLKSVDYDIWQCPSCQTQQQYRYRRWFSRYSKCPSCQYRTLKVTKKTLERATTSSTGRGVKTSSCRHCNLHRERYYTIPKIQESSSSSSSSSGSSSRSSSSGGSFGGGRSSGGGASGSW
jgi:uncharacterized protein